MREIYGFPNLGKLVQISLFTVEKEMREDFAIKITSETVRLGAELDLV